MLSDEGMFLSQQEAKEGIYQGGEFGIGRNEERMQSRSEGSVASMARQKNRGNGSFSFFHLLDVWSSLCSQLLDPNQQIVISALQTISKRISSTE